jgi:hypothetical protein
MCAGVTSSHYVVDPFLATRDWQTALRRVWGRDDCMVCGRRFQSGERVRWLRASASGGRKGCYAVIHVTCAPRGTAAAAGG